MSYFLAHLEDRRVRSWRDTDPREEIYVLPVGRKVAFPVAIGSLRRLLPLLHAEERKLEPPCCPGCGARLPAPTPKDLEG